MLKKNKIKLWADLKGDLIPRLEQEYEVEHILTASPKPVADLNGQLIVGCGNILRFLQLA